jgi:hypothetical protein
MDYGLCDVCVWLTYFSLPVFQHLLPGTDPREGVVDAGQEHTRRVLPRIECSGRGVCDIIL